MKKIDKDSKVGIAIHTFGPIDPKVYFNHLGTMRSWAGKYDIFFCGIDKHRTADARNILVQSALSGGCTHLLSIDADHIIPDHMLEVLSLNAEASITSGLVCKRKPPYGQVGFVKFDGDYHQVNLPVDGKSYLVDIPAMGCTLFDMEIFKRIKSPWFLDRRSVMPDGTYYNKRSDSVFFERCGELGIKMIIDTRVVIGHVGDPVVHYPNSSIDVARMNQEDMIRLDADALKWQAPVYEVATELADEGKIASVLDLGCGNPIKLKNLGLMDVTGIDYPNKIADITRRGVEGRWIGQDLNHHFNLHKKFDLIIAADVIEHLNSVTEFFKVVDTHLADGGTLLISTPDKRTTGESNILHVQEFDGNEFSGILAAHGFKYELSQYTQETEDGNYTNLMAICTKQEK
jgi:SAM-dependent methyltransferase